VSELLERHRRLPVQYEPYGDPPARALLSRGHQRQISI
jgi:hypothetical protein